MEYSSPWAGFVFTTLVMIGTDCTGSYTSNFHTITTTTDPLFVWSWLHAWTSNDKYVIRSIHFVFRYILQSLVTILMTFHWILQSLVTVLMSFTWTLQRLVAMLMPIHWILQRLVAMLITAHWILQRLVMVLMTVHWNTSSTFSDDVDCIYTYQYSWYITRTWHSGTVENKL